MTSAGLVFIEGLRAISVPKTISCSCVLQGVVLDEEAGPGSKEDHEVSTALQTQVTVWQSWTLSHIGTKLFIYKRHF